MTPTTVVVRRVGVGRALVLLLLVLWLFWRYFVAPALEAVDRVTPWAGVVPGSCVAQARPAGFSGMANDAGLALRRLAEGPPSGAQMVAWAESLGRETKTVAVAFEDGKGGRRLLPLAPTPPEIAVPVSTASSTAVDGRLTDGQVAALALGVGWPAAEVPNVVRRVRAESGGDPAARDYVDGTHWGLLQLGTAEREQYVPDEDAFDPRVNLRGGLRLWQERGWQPWRASDAAVAADATPVQAVAAASQGLAGAPVACGPGQGPQATWAGVSEAADGVDPVAWPARSAVLQTFGPMTVGGWGTRPNATEHDELDSQGRRASRALDFMVEGERGDRVAQYLIDQAAVLRVEYLIWDRRIWRSASGWRPYTGRSPHTDHVHLTVLPATGQVRLAG